MKQMACCVTGCKSRYDQGVTLHKFSHISEYPERYEMWIHNCGLDGVGDKIIRNSRVCRLHFMDSYLYPKNRLCRLAVPTLNLSVPNPYIPEELKSTAKEQVVSTKRATSLSKNTNKRSATCQMKMSVLHTPVTHVLLGVPMHRFPHPEKKRDLFNAWLSVLGDKIKETDRMKVYKSKRVCDHHFDPEHKVSGNRLKVSTIPSVNLQRLKTTYTTLVQADHCYSRPLRESSRSVPVMDVTNLPDPSRLTVDAEIIVSSGSAETTCPIVPPGKSKIESEQVEPSISVNLKEGDVNHDHSYTLASNAIIRNIVPIGAVKRDKSTKSVTTTSDGTQIITSTGIGFRNLSRRREVSDEGNSTIPPTPTAPEPANASSLACDLPPTAPRLEEIQEVPPDTFDDDDFVPPPLEPDTPVIEDTEEVTTDTAAAELFSWQKSELIEADEPEEPPPPVEPTLALTCEPGPAPAPAPGAHPAPDRASSPARDPDHAVPEISVPIDVEGRCHDCGEVNDGFEFWCVQCSCGALCGACGARPPHHAHYVLRAPVAATRAQTQAVLALIRQQLQNENLITQLDDDGVKLEVKEEPPEQAAAAEPSEPDPLACDPRPDPRPDPGPDPGPDPDSDPGPDPDDPALPSDTDEHDAEETTHDPPPKRRRLNDSTENFSIVCQLGTQVIQQNQIEESQVVPDSPIEGSSAVPHKQQGAPVLHSPLKESSHHKAILENKRPKEPFVIRQTQQKGSPVIQFSQLSGAQVALLGQLEGFEVVKLTPKGTQVPPSLVKVSQIPHSLKGSKATQHSQFKVTAQSDLRKERLQPSQSIESTAQSSFKRPQLPQHSPLRGSQLSQLTQAKGSQLSQHSQVKGSEVAQNSLAKGLQLLQSVQHTVSQRPQYSLLKGSQAANETHEPEPPETVIIDLDDVAEETVVNTEGETVEYLEEELLETDTETIDDDVIDKDYTIEELDDDSDEQTEYSEDQIGYRIAGKVAGREASRRKNELEESPVRGHHESMARTLLSEAVVQVRPLTSLEIRHWTQDNSS